VIYIVSNHNDTLSATHDKYAAEAEVNRLQAESPAQNHHYCYREIPELKEVSYVIVHRADDSEADSDGKIYAANELRAMHDGSSYFWFDDLQCLMRRDE